MEKLNLSNVKIFLPYHVALSVDVIHGGNTIRRIVVNEGASTCVMSLSCWKALGSLELVPSNTLLTALEGRSFCPHGILPTFEIKLVGKEVSVQVEVIDAPLDYNILLGRSWTYAMCAIALAFLQVVVFPHEGKLVTVDQLSFTRKDRMETNESTVPLVDQVKPAAQSLGDGMYASLMGTFDLPAPINYIGSTSVGKSIATVVDRTDPWVLPPPHELEVPLLTVEVAYQAITQNTVDPIPAPLTVLEDLEKVYFPAWAENSSLSIDCLDTVLPSNEAILEAMSGRDKICEDLHHRSYFLPELSRIENQEFRVRLSEDVDRYSSGNIFHIPLGKDSFPRKRVDRCINIS